MAEVQYLVLLASVLITLILGLVIHSFIIGVNVSDWWKGGSMTPVDHVVTSLGISRMCAQSALCLYLFLNTLDINVTLIILDAVYSFFTYVNIWLTTLLSVVFCLKISNLHSRLFLHLRRVILQRTVYFIVASMLLSAFSCFTPLITAIPEVINGGAHNTTGYIGLHCPNINYVYNLATGAIIPMLFYYISSILLFASLHYHMTRMKRSSNLAINLETYYSVLRFLSFTFIHNTTVFFFNFVCIFYYFFVCLTLPWLYIFLGFLPSLHSSYLIYRTTKLRNQMSKVLQNVIDFLLQRQSTEIRENIQVIAE